MPPPADIDSQTDDIVEQKVRRRVAKKVLRDIRQQVDEVERQVANEKRASKWILPLSLALVMVIAAITLWPVILRILSALINAD